MKYPRRAPGPSPTCAISCQNSPRPDAPPRFPAPEELQFSPSLLFLLSLVYRDGFVDPLPGAGGRPRRAQPPTGRTCRARTHRASPSCPSARGGAAPLLAHTKRTVLGTARGVTEIRRAAERARLCTAPALYHPARPIDWDALRRRGFPAGHCCAPRQREHRRRRPIAAGDGHGQRRLRHAGAGGVAADAADALAVFALSFLDCCPLSSLLEIERPTLTVPWGHLGSCHFPHPPSASSAMARKIKSRQPVWDCLLSAFYVCVLRRCIFGEPPHFPLIKSSWASPRTFLRAPLLRRSRGAAPAASPHSATRPG